MSDALKPRRLLLKGSAAAALATALALGYWQSNVQPVARPGTAGSAAVLGKRDPIEGAAGIGIDVRIACRVHVGTSM